MIDPLTLEKARSLLASGLSYTKVSDLLGVGRSTLYRCINPSVKEKEKNTRAKWTENNKEKIRRAQRERRKRNPRKLNPQQKRAKREAAKRWAQNNPDKVKAIRKRCYHKNRFKKLQATRLWRAKNAERCAQQRRDWLQRNRGTVNGLNADRRRQKRNAVGPASIIEKLMIDNYYKQAQEISKETGVQYHVDHIWPLSKGGPHLPWNLRVITASENLAKYNKI